MREHKEHNFDKHLQRRYGITLAERNARYERQGGRCAICRDAMALEGKHAKAVHVDHCHKTGTTRGLLCAHCNRAIGLLQDSPENAERAAAYLRHSSNPQQKAA